MKAISASRRIGLPLVVLFAILLLAGGLRLFRLGAWPFAGDELSTIAEAELLFEGGDDPADSQAQRLPRLLPLAYLIHHESYRLFGKDEFGSRVGPAILGTAQAVLALVLLSGLFRWPTAVAAALLLALWPPQLFFSQVNRFYIAAAFFASLSMLLGAWAVRRQSVPLICLACLAAFAAVLCQTFLALLLAGLLAGVVASALAERTALPWKLIVVIVAAQAALAIFTFWYLVPLGRGWNRSEAWGYTLVHSLFASVNQLGWPTCLLALLGVGALVGRRDGQGWYWVVWAVLWVAEAAFLPAFVVYHPGYMFPLALGALVPAAYAIGTIYESLRPQHPLIAVGWLTVACGLSLPGVVSHYADGSRHDFRTAGAYLAEHSRAEDTVVIPTIMVTHYADVPGRVVMLPGADKVAFLRGKCGGERRVWIVVSSGRSGLPADLREWLGAHCHQRFQVRKKRFDYYEYIVEVYLYDPSGRRKADAG